MNRLEDTIMKGWASPGNHCLLYFPRAYTVLLCLLVGAATCAARQAQPQSQTQQPRRIPPASRLKVIQLPEPSTTSAVSVEQALLSLRSLQAPGNQRLDLPKISQLAWAIQGATLAAAANSAGATPAPTEATAMRIYFVLPDGVFLYSPVDHTLQQTGDSDVREPLAAALLNQTGAPTGGCQIILAASPQDFGLRYGARARTIMVLQAGRMSQNLQMEAVAQGLTFVSIESVDAAAVRRIARVLRTLEPLYVAFVGYPAGQVPQTPAQGRASQATALLVVPSQGFQDEELLVTKRALEQAGVQVMVASTRMGLLTGMLGGAIRGDLLLNQANLDNFNGIVFIGGVGTIDYLNNSTVLSLARQAAVRRKVLAAIGTAPSILASAGVLKGVRSTALLSEQARLVQGGAIYTGNAVEKDGLIITATGALAASTFARAILDGLVETGQSGSPATPATPATK
jgi:protease I